MSHPLRFDLPGVRHHVMNRGARKALVFDDDECRAHFLALLSELPERFGVRVHGYAVMGTHFHLMLQCPVGGMGQAMQYLQSRYARWLNASRGWDGPVWRGRYRSRVVDDDAYWRHLLTYIHLNPVQAGLARSPGDWPWSSHGAFVGEVEEPDFLELSELRTLYGTVDAYRTYLAEVAAGRGDMPPGFDEGHLWGSPSEAWKQRTLTAPAPVSMDEAWAILLEVTGLDREALMAAPRGRKGNPARWVAIWWLTTATTSSQAAVARTFGVSPPFASRVMQRVRTRTEDDTSQWAVWANELDARRPI